MKFYSKSLKNLIHENAYEYIVCKMAAILSGGRWVNFNQDTDKYIHSIYGI